MGLPNPFSVIFVIAAIMIMVSAGFAIVAPQFGVSLPSPPVFPTLQSLGNSGSGNSGISGSQTSGNSSSGTSSLVWVDSGGREIVDSSGNVVVSDPGGYVIYGEHYGAAASWINASGAYPLFQVSIGATSSTAGQTTGWWNFSWNGLGMIYDYLVFFGQIIWYFVLAAGYMISVMSVMTTVLSNGLIPSAVASGIIILFAIVFMGALLTFIRGSSGDGSK